MKRNFVSNLEPYSSVSLSSVKDVTGLLEDILSAKNDFHFKKIDKPVILYGAGNLGKMAKFFLDYLGIPFFCVLDKNVSKYKNDKFWQGVKIVHPDDLGKKEKTNCLLIVCIVTSPLVVLHNELLINGWQNVAFFYDVAQAYSDEYPLNNGWRLDKLSEREGKSIKRFFSLLADDKSQAYFLQFLAWRKLRVELLFHDLEIDNNNRFFIPEIIKVLNKNEVFVDCGAYQGLVIEKFLEIVNNKYKAIYAIEPDRGSFKILRAQLKNVPNVKIVNCALGNNKGEEKFYEGFGFASKLSKNGNDLVKVVRLDELRIEATLIKMHLEGGELQALKGAINTIKKCRPLVMVTTYHNSDGVWKIPFFLINNIRNYKFYFRLHSWGGTGAIIYVIPHERIK